MALVFPVDMSTRSSSDLRSLAIWAKALRSSTSCVRRRQPSQMRTTIVALRSMWLVGVATACSGSAAGRQAPQLQRAVTLHPSVYPSARNLRGSWHLRLELTECAKAEPPPRRCWAEGVLTLDTVPSLSGAAGVPEGIPADSAVVRGQVALDLPSILASEPRSTTALAWLGSHSDSVFINVGAACADCGNLYFEARFLGDSAVGLWRQSFFPGDGGGNGRFRIWRRATR